MTRAPALIAMALLTASVASADPGPPPPLEHLRAQVAQLKQRIADLERENATLRRQWGQVTMELDRVRAQNAVLKKAGGPAGGGAHVVRGAKPQAAAGTGEVEKLRRANEDLRIRNARLTELAGLAPRDQRIAAQEARITTRYDEDAGRTVVRTQATPLPMTAGTRADHFLSLAYSYDSRAMAAPPRQVTMFIQAVYSGGIYSQGQPLTLTIDGEAVSLAASEYDADRRQITVAGRRRISKDDETLTFLLGRDVLRRLARAVSVTGRMGVASFELTHDQIALFAAVAARIEAGM